MPSQLTPFGRVVEVMRSCGLVVGIPGSPCAVISARALKHTDLRLPTSPPQTFLPTTDGDRKRGRGSGVGGQVGQGGLECDTVRRDDMQARHPGGMGRSRPLLKICGGAAVDGARRLVTESVRSGHVWASPKKYTNRVMVHRIVHFCVYAIQRLGARAQGKKNRGSQGPRETTIGETSWHDVVVSSCTG